MKSVKKRSLVLTRQNHASPPRNKLCWRRETFQRLFCSCYRIQEKGREEKQARPSVRPSVRSSYRSAYRVRVIERVLTSKTAARENWRIGDGRSHCLESEQQQRAASAKRSRHSLNDTGLTPRLTGNGALALAFASAPSTATFLLQACGLIPGQGSESVFFNHSVGCTWWRLSLFHKSAFSKPCQVLKPMSVRWALNNLAVSVG